MKNILLSISIFFFPSISSSQTIYQTQFINKKETKVYSYIVDKNMNIKKCEEKNGCHIFYIKDKNYCKELDKIEDDIQAQIRMKWECPRYESLNELRKYDIHLTDNPIFSEYTFNLIKIFSNFNNKRRYNAIYFNKINTPVGLSPNNIMIPIDMNDIITDITIYLDSKKNIISESYKLKSGILFERKYTYKNNKLYLINETSKKIIKHYLMKIINILININL